MAGISTKWSHGDRFAANDLRRSALENDLAAKCCASNKRLGA
jgi:chemotaxis family two-component system sensor kinase Cph1